MNIMRGVGLATAAGLALLIALFVRRDRARRRPA
jgi:hypothetical protein